MGCNCKASQRISRVKKYYGYEPETKENIKIGEKIKKTFQAILIWILLLIMAPLTLLFILIARYVFNKKNITFFKKIKLRL
jgi:hypothetical protein